jgi:hypothetical protein
MGVIEKGLKGTFKFNCEICDYHTSNKKGFTKHLLTAKHSRLTNANQKSPKIPRR